ncbi:hypothetical protein BZG29_26705 [Janthinobacterium sp. LM6]|uniref:acyltransferase n=1 Tax=Janthinobacterium sp. LM6 TaxID=1938606 RepID=UPI000983A916|nr:acyltransferase [Janthinobacterium sp. LM6]AQR71514.1 hypothetical protein BZG29_26705 [Janthinobacterium sp. LM6]
MMILKIVKFLNLPFHEKINRCFLMLAILKTKIYYNFVFKKIGKRSLLFKPLYIGNPQCIEIGNNTMIRSGARLEVIGESNAWEPELLIGDNVNIEQNVHIVCGSRISIGNNVSITGHVAIVDVIHPYNDIYNPIKVGDRVQCEGNYVEIGDGVFIGYGSIILPNTRIGKNSIIGAHTVVNSDVPSYCIAGGNPMRIIKKYNFELNEWVKMQ